MSDDPVKDFLKKIGSKGGTEAAKNMTAAQRQRRARKAVKAREAKRKIERGSLQPG